MTRAGWASSAARFVPGARAAAPPAPSDHCLVVAGRQMLVGTDGPFPLVGDVMAAAAASAGLDWVPLGALDDTPIWACALPEPARELGEWRGWPAFAAKLGEPLAALAGRALQVMTWRRTHRYCGACAAELADVPDEHARRCPACDLYVPMQLSPAVLVAVRRPGRAGGPDELLLVRHSYGPTEIWALVAGFVEAGESLEEAAHREAREEVGIALDELTYFGSQPWAMSGPGVVLAGFLATCAPDAEPVIDGKEIAQARWFAPDALPEALPPGYSMSRWLIDATAGRVEAAAGRVEAAAGRSDAQ